MTKTTLVPTTIVNKNGVTTTVHKRVDASGKNVSVLIPSPTVPLMVDAGLSEAEAEAIVGSALITVQSDEDFDHDIGDFRILERRLALWEPSVTRAYAESIEGHPSIGYEGLAASVLHNDHEPKDAAYLLLAAKEDKYLDSEWSGFERGTYTYGRAKSIHWGIMSLSEEFGIEFPELPFEAASRKPVEIFTALTVVTYAVYHSDTQKGIVSIIAEDGEGITLNNSDLISLIIRRPEDARRISDIVVARDNPDAAIIEDILDAEVPALSDGMI